MRIGNGAVGQRQIDVYGELMDSVYLYNRSNPDLLRHVDERCPSDLKWLSQHWEEPDEGVWEVRGPRQRFTYSALMTWVAFDRAQRLARDRGLPAPVEKLAPAGSASAYQFVQNECWDPKLGAYVMYPGSDKLDASMLSCRSSASPGRPIPASSAPWTGWGRNWSRTASSTVTRSTGHDGLAGDEGTFNLCSFWYVDALTKAGRLREARLVFEKMLTYANHVGLYAEEIGPSGEALGNFPQAFTHLALISSAVNLDAALDKAGSA